MSVVDEPWCKGQQRAEEQVEPRQVVAIVLPLTFSGKSALSGVVARPRSSDIAS